MWGSSVETFSNLNLRRRQAETSGHWGYTVGGFHHVVVHRICRLHRELVLTSGEVNVSEMSRGIYGAGIMSRDISRIRHQVDRIDEEINP